MKIRVDKVLSGQMIVNPGRSWDRVHGVSDPRDEDGKVLVTTDSGRNWMSPDTEVDVV